MYKLNNFYGSESAEAPFDYPKITKDLHKLWAEPGRHGRCMFHICQAANAGTMPALVAKYDAVTQNARDLAAETVRRQYGSVQRNGMPDGWFLLLILILHQRGDKIGSYLHRATWGGNQWAFLEPELLSPNVTANK